jgi:hypothetical protein
MTIFAIHLSTLTTIVARRSPFETRDTTKARLMTAIAKTGNKNPCATVGIDLSMMLTSRSMQHQADGP